MIMIENVLLPDEAKLSLDKIEIIEGIILLSVSSNNPTNLCPYCGMVSDHVHSHYQRCPGDLPLVGFTVCLDMNVRRFFCDNNDCKRRIFTERIPSMLTSYARRTNRLASQQRQVAFALGGEAGAGLLTIMGMAASPDTLIRLIRKTPEPEIETPKVLGIDEWAKRKGQSYGTILVDLEKHRAIDLLPEKSSELLATWLKEHPGVEVISRDRGTEYIKGATEGAPGAIQVADRWHLLSNLKDTLKRMLEGKRATLKAAAGSEMTGNVAESEGSAHCPELGVNFINAVNNDITLAEASKPLLSPEEAITSVLTPENSVEDSVQQQIVPKEQTDIPRQLTKGEQEKQARHERRQERYEEVRQLYQQGLSIRKIARGLKLSRITVRKYIEAEACPMYPEGITRESKLTPYVDYVRQRWESGCHNASQIWRELYQLGFDGSRGLVARWAAKERVKFPCPQLEESDGESNPASKSEVVPWSPNRAAWLLIKPEDDLTLEDRQALEKMKQSDQNVAEAYSLGQRFINMVRERQPDELLPWLEDAAKSGIDTLKGFANGIQQDLAAVINALSLPWSNGQTEGQVNRLKLIKRQMYGRANFDLLRKRVITYQARC
jgi:transposase